MSSLGRVEPINLIRPKLKAILAGQYSNQFLQKDAKYTLSYKVSIY